jgi:hypothetical protein
MRYLFAVLLAFLVSPANATTYDYTGQPFTSFEGPCNASSCTSITGSVTFDFDTSNFTGTLTLSAGDTASLSEGISPSLVSAAIGANPNFPSFTEWFNPPADTYGFTSQLTGSLTLVDGAVTFWVLDGSTGQTGCGGGPGCASGASSVYSLPTYDSSTTNGYLVSASASNSGGGSWTEETASVPELSTWAMLLVGFAGFGLLTRRSQKLPNPAGGV